MCLPDNTLPPLFTNDATRPGSSERLLIDAAKLAGLALEFSYAPPARCLAAVERGEVEAILTLPTLRNFQSQRFPGGGSAEVASVDESRHLFRVRFLLLTQPDSKLRWNGRDFSGADPKTLTFGTRRAFSASIELLRAHGLTVDDGAATLRQVLEMLQRRRFDVAVAMDHELRRELGQSRPDWMQVIDTPLINNAVYAVPSLKAWQEHQPRVEAWWEAIARLRDQSAYQY